MIRSKWRVNRWFVIPRIFSKFQMKHFHSLRPPQVGGGIFDPLPWARPHGTILDGSVIFNDKIYNVSYNLKLKNWKHEIWNLNPRYLRIFFEISKISNCHFWELNYLWYLKFFEGSAIRAPIFFGNLQLNIWVKTIVTPPVNGRFTADLWQISCTHPLQPLIRYPELPKCAHEGLPMSAVLFRCIEAHRKRFSSGRGPKRPCRRGCGPAAQDCQVGDLREVVTRIHAYMAASP